MHWQTFIERLSKEPRIMYRAWFPIEAMIKGYRGKLGIRSSWLCGSRTEIGTLLNHTVGIFNSSRRDRTGQRAVRIQNLRDLLLEEKINIFTCPEQIFESFFFKIFAQVAYFRIMRKFAPFKNFPLYGMVTSKGLLHII